MPGIDYERMELEQRIRNAEEVLDNLAKPDLQLKIQNFANRYGLSKKFVINKIMNDNSFAIVFAKEPGRQNFHENCAAEFIRSLPLVESFSVLPKGGSGALYIVRDIGVAKDRAGDSKSIDFKWNYRYGGRELAFYATHKYTKDGGGSQDNQLNDVFHFHENARSIVDKNVFFFSITDGKYYESVFTKDSTSALNRWTKIDYINNRYSGTRNRAVDSASLLYGMAGVILDWLRYLSKSMEIPVGEVNKVREIQNQNKGVSK